jgi:hypothetical protein
MIMTVTNAQVSADIGEIYDSLDGGTTAVAAIRTRAENFVKLQLSSADDEIVRPLVDAMVVNQAVGGIDPVNKTIGSLSVGAKDMQSMVKFFMNEAKRAAVIKGISLDGLRIELVDSEVA